MIRKTSFFLIGAIATVLLVSGMASEEASAFEPTKKEQKAIEKYIKTTINVEQLCSVESNESAICVKLEELQMRYLIKMNDMGIYAEEQAAPLDHLTEKNDSTRKAAKAGIEPKEIEIPEEIEISAQCASCGDPKTMYVKSAYKDEWSFLGIPVFDHYAGPDSADISTGGNTFTDFNPRWSGTNSGMTPYCQTSSITQPASATYMLGLLVKTTYGAILQVTTTSESSYFVWYDPNDQIGNQEINNLANGFNIHCDISGVTVN